MGRCTVTPLVTAAGRRGVVRGRQTWTTVPETTGERPRDLVQRQAQATRPNQLWVSDRTYVATVARLRLRGLLDRRLRPAYRRLAGGDLVAQ